MSLVWSQAHLALCHSFLCKALSRPTPVSLHQRNKPFLLRLRRRNLVTLMWSHADLALFHRFLHKALSKMSSLIMKSLLVPQWPRMPTSPLTRIRCLSFLMMTPSECTDVRLSSPKMYVHELRTQWIVTHQWLACRDRSSSHNRGWWAQEHQTCW